MMDCINKRVSLPRGVYKPESHFCCSSVRGWLNSRPLIIPSTGRSLCGTVPRGVFITLIILLLCQSVNGFDETTFSPYTVSTMRQDIHLRISKKPRLEILRQHIATLPKGAVSDWVVSTLDDVVQGRLVPAETASITKELRALNRKLTKALRK